MVCDIFQVNSQLHIEKYYQSITRSQAQRKSQLLLHSSSYPLIIAVSRLQDTISDISSGMT